jgi:hypothetical protein
MGGTKNMVQWQAAVNIVMNLWIPQKVDLLTILQWLLAYGAGLCSLNKLRIMYALCNRYVLPHILNTSVS